MKPASKDGGNATQSPSGLGLRREPALAEKMLTCLITSGR
jgi:hypothetical protein